MCYHSLNIRIRSFTPCCATVLGKWANTPWWDLPSPWRGHGPSPKVTFGVMMPNAGVPPAWPHHHNTIVKAEESECEIEVINSTVWIVRHAGKILGIYLFLGHKSLHDPVRMQFPYSTISIDMHFPSQWFCPAFRWWPGAPHGTNSRAGNSQWQNWWLWRASGRLCWPLPLTSGRPGLQRRLWDDGHHRSQMPELG